MSSTPQPVMSDRKRSRSVGEDLADRGVGDENLSAGDQPFITVVSKRGSKKKKTDSVPLSQPAGFAPRNQPAYLEEENDPACVECVFCGVPADIPSSLRCRTCRHCYHLACCDIP